MVAVTKQLFCPTCQRVHAVRRPQAVRGGGATWNDVIEIVGGLFVLLLCCFALWLWLAILAVSQ